MSQLSFDFAVDAVSTDAVSTKPHLDYQLLVSKRARRLSLRVEPGRGIVVTVPQRFPRKAIPAFVEENRGWIESALSEIEQQTPERFREWPPTRLALPAIRSVLVLRYAREAERNVAETGLSAFELPEEEGVTVVEVTLQSDPADRKGVAQEIAERLSSIAKQILPGRLSVHAARHCLHYSRAQIRGQRTLWGSCSSNGTISLNYKLLFLPPSLMDYVLLHELAHTVCMDHSAKFWRVLGRIHPDAKAADDKLKLAGREVPAWLELA